MCIFQSNSSRCDNLENWDNFIASHTAALAQDWIKKKRPGFIGKNGWPTNSPELNPLDYVWCAVLGLNTEKAADIHHWNVWTVDEKVVQSLIHYYWIFRTRLYVHLKKWNLKFKLLYLLNHTSYFNKICRIYGLNPHLNSVNLVKKSSIIPEIYNFS